MMTREQVLEEIKELKEKMSRPVDANAEQIAALEAKADAVRAEQLRVAYSDDADKSEKIQDLLDECGRICDKIEKLRPYRPDEEGEDWGDYQLGKIDGYDDKREGKVADLVEIREKYGIFYVMGYVDGMEGDDER